MDWLGALGACNMAFPVPVSSMAHSYILPGQLESGVLHLCPEIVNQGVGWLARIPCGNGVVSAIFAGSADPAGATNPKSAWPMFHHPRTHLRTPRIRTRFQRLTHGLLPSPVPARQ